MTAPLTIGRNKNRTIIVPSAAAINRPGGMPSFVRYLNKSPLLQAADLGSLELLKAVWEQGIDRGTSDMDRVQALNLAIEAHQTAGALYLLDHGVPVNPVSPQVESPFSVAART